LGHFVVVSVLPAITPISAKWRPNHEDYETLNRYKYYSLKKRLNEAGADELVPAKTKPDFIELVGGVMTPGSAECTIEWADGSGATLRMHIRGAGLSELASVAGVFRGGRA
jgi:hypothetical protein